MSEPVFSPFYPRTGESPLAFDFTVVDRQPDRDGREMVRSRAPDGSTVWGCVKVIPEVPPTDEQERPE